MKNSYFVFFILMLIPMGLAYADDGDCWFILCWFTFHDKLTTEEIYVKSAENGRDRAINFVNNEISELREHSKIMSNAQKVGKISVPPTLINGVNDRADFLQSLLDEQEYVKNNPEEFYTQKTLVQKAMEYYKVKPDGTPCDEDRRWVETRNGCVREQTAHRVFYSWDLEWLRYVEVGK